MSPRKKDDEGVMTHGTARATTKKRAAIKTARSEGVKAKKRATSTSLSAGAGTQCKMSMTTRPAEEDDEDDDC